MSASTAAAQLKRLLTLIPRLADGDEHPIEDIAAIVGIPAEQLIDDLHSLVERYDTPGGFVDGVQIFQDGRMVSAVTPHFLRPMRLTMTELCALELGLVLILRERMPDEEVPVRQALERLRKVITHIPGDDKFAGLRDASIEAGAVGRERLIELKSAVKERRQISVLYMRGSSTEAEWQTLCPYTLAFANGMWYVVGHCTESAGLRFFRLDRIHDLKPLSATYEIPDDFVAERLFKDGHPHMMGEAAEFLRVRYSAMVARWIAEREGRALEADGTLVVDRPLSDRQWAVRHVFQYGPEAEVLHPADVRDMVVAKLRSM